MPSIFQTCVPAILPAFCAAAATGHTTECAPALLAPVPAVAAAIGPSPTWGVVPPDGDEPAAFCFAPDTDPEVMARFYAAMDGVAPRSNPVDRWQNTAHGPTGPEGTPITLTYSFVPDGTSVPSSTWSSGGPSTLHAYLDGAYGSSEAWQSLIHEAMNRWAALSGITFIYEPNDDGVPLSSNNRGILGIRGDIRMSAVTIDGSSSVLAYNYYPDHGDMVLDPDTWLNSPRSLQNLIMHEVGHGIGLAHVCPVQNTKIMEPFITSSYFGPQHDDIRGVQYFYGDVAEPDNSPAQAVDIGELPLATTSIGLPPAPSVANASTRSISRPGDEDWLRFTLDTPSSVVIAVAPVGTSYYEGEQDCPDNVGSCCRGMIINSRAMSKLTLRVLDETGQVIIAEAASAMPGMTEVISDLVLEAGTYHIRVAGQGQDPEAQLYLVTTSREVISTQTCPCETDGNTDAVDVHDLLAYLDRWFVQSADAELTGDDPAVIDVFDLLAFLDCWFPASAGTPCP